MDHTIFCEGCGIETSEYRVYEDEELCTPCWLDYRDEIIADVEDGCSYLDGEDIIDALLLPL